jgi:hypothetical protein
MKTKKNIYRMRYLLQVVDIPNNPPIIEIESMTTGGAYLFIKDVQADQFTIRIVWPESNEAARE